MHALRALLACLALSLFFSGCKPKPVRSPYTTVPVTTGRIIGQVTATGTLSALVTVQVGSQVSGRIAELHADFNSPVKKGEVLAKIDPQLFEAALDSAKANEMQAEGQLAQAQAQSINAAVQYKRERDLFARKLVAQADLDTAKATNDADAAAVLSAQGNLAQAKAQHKQASVNLAYTTISSPIDGTVISRAVDVGQTVAASLAAPTIFTIAQDLKKMQVDTSVAEADVGKLQAQMPAAFTVDAYPGKTFRGTIRQIRYAPTTVQNVVTYDAVIDVSNPDLELRPGMTTNVTFVYARANHALEVPNAALRFRPPMSASHHHRAPGSGDAGPGMAGDQGHHHRGAPDGGGSGWAHGDHGDHGDHAPALNQKKVYVLRDGQPVAVPLTVGITDGSHTEVLAGDLHEGDLVIIDAAGGPGDEAKKRFGRMF